MSDYGFLIFCPFIYSTFKGYIPNKVLAETPLGEIMILSFAAAELGMYLNTHPEDKEALQLRNNYVRLLRDATAVYEKEIGPLTMESPMDATWSWINGPWPWEQQ